MGEKEIVQDDVIGGGGQGAGVVGGGGKGGGGSSGLGGGTGGGTGGKGGGGSGDLKSGGGGGSPVTGQGKPGGSSQGDGGGGSPGDAVNDCFDMEQKQKDLLAQLESARKANQDAADKAIDAFYDKYRDEAQKAKITDAVVESNNVVGEAIIDVAIKATEKFGGKEGEEYAKKAQKVKDAVLPELKKWMKDGATSAELEAAKAGYADFVGAATAANEAAAGAARVKAEIEALQKEMAAKGCGGAVAIPTPYLKTFDIAPFGKGAEKGEAGPTMHTQNLGGQGSHYADDMFKAGGKTGLTFYH